MWTEKHRPRTIDSLVLEDDKKASLQSIAQIIGLGEAPPHLLMHGPPGCGKTSTAIILASFFASQNVLSLNAGHDRGIQVIRRDVGSFVSRKRLYSPPITDSKSPHQEATTLKMVLLDEADAMTNDAQSALRRVLDENSNDTFFCLLCNNASKIIPAIRSRCVEVNFSCLSDECVRRCIGQVLLEESREMDDEFVDAIVYVSKGDARKAISVLQLAVETWKDAGNPTSKHVFKVTGIAPPQMVDDYVETLLDLVKRGDVKRAFMAGMDLALKHDATYRNVTFGDMSTRLFQLDEKREVRLEARLLVSLTDLLSDLEFERESVGIPFLSAWAYLCSKVGHGDLGGYHIERDMM